MMNNRDGVYFREYTDREGKQHLYPINDVNNDSYSFGDYILSSHKYKNSFADMIESIYDNTGIIKEIFTSNEELMKYKIRLNTILFKYMDALTVLKFAIRNEINNTKQECHQHPFPYFIKVNEFTNNIKKCFYYINENFANGWADFNLNEFIHTDYTIEDCNDIELTDREIETNLIKYYGLTSKKLSYNEKQQKKLFNNRTLKEWLIDDIKIRQKIKDDVIEEITNLIAEYKQFKMNYNIIDKNEKEEQYKKLQNHIVAGLHSNFYVFDMEASVGKTRETEKILADDKTNNKYLFVLQFIEGIKEITKNINDLAGEEIATYYNSDFTEDKKKQFLDSVSDYKVVCISHAKYLQLCKDEKQRNIITFNRNVLIIDEHIDPIKKVVYNKGIYKDLYTIFSHHHLTSALSYLDNINNILLNNIDITLKESVLVIDSNRNKMIAYLDEFINEVKKCVADGFNHTVRDCTSNTTIKFTNKNSIVEYLISLKNFYNNPYVFIGDNDNQGIVTYDNDFKLFRLDNNIILNANGKLQPLYFFNKDEYEVAELPPVIDHRNFIVCNIPVNTSRTAKKNKYIDFCNDVKRITFDILDLDKSNTLIIGSKEESQHFEDGYNYAYFGNIVGKNEWRNLQDVVIISTPNYSNYEYVLMYLYFKRDKLTLQELNGLNTSVKKVGGSGITVKSTFDNPSLEGVKLLSITEQIYQATKRINRDMQGKSKVIIFCNNENVINALSSKLNNCKSYTYPQLIDEFEVKKTEKQKQRNNKQDLFVNEFKQYIIKCLTDINNQQTDYFRVDAEGNYYVLKKDYYSDSVFLANQKNESKHFQLHILNNQDVLNFLKTNTVVIKNQRIIFI